MLVHIKELFPNQGSEVVGKFAYPAFNTHNLEMTLGIVRAAEELDAPVILQVSEGATKYAGLTTLYELMATVAIRANVPVALHMDHGRDIKQLKTGIELGFSSVMIDHSEENLEKNIQDTQILVQFAHQEGAWVQGEVGRIRGNEDWVSVSDADALLTDPKDAKKYVEATSVDTLACAFGTVHGIVKMRGEAAPHLDIPRIKAIYDAVKIPLVLHGASGVNENLIRQAIEGGIAIINIDTELRMAFSLALRKSLAEKPDEVDPRAIMKPVIEALTVAAGKKIQQFGAKNIVDKAI